MMADENVFRDVERIEIEPPPGVDPSSTGDRIVIDDPEKIEEIVAGLKLEISDAETIAQCKVPQGFTVRFVTPERTIVADVTVSGHRHFLTTDVEEGRSTHFDLPREFEEAIHPYLMAAVGREKQGE